MRASAGTEFEAMPENMRMLTRNLVAAMILALSIMAGCGPTETKGRPVPDDNNENSILPESTKVTNDSTRLAEDSIYRLHRGDSARRDSAR